MSRPPGGVLGEGAVVKNDGITGENERKAGEKRADQAGYFPSAIIRAMAARSDAASSR